MEKSIRLLKLHRRKKLNKRSLTAKLCFLLFLLVFNASANDLNITSSESENSKEFRKEWVAVENTVDQQKTVSGKVTDSSGSPIPGVSIVVKGTTTGTISDSNGKFTLTNIPDRATLQFSFVGMKTQEIPVAEKTSINIVLEDETTNLEEVVAVGYGTQKKVDVTGAVSTVKAEALANIPTTNLSSTLGGRLSGVFVETSTGVPGVSSELRIRSGASWNSSPVLYVIDGIVRDKESFDLLDPSEVDNITVLKDAASAAIYGSRSTGGVLLITTKKGTLGKATINYSGSYSFDSPTSEIELMDPVNEGIPWMNNIFPDQNDPSWGWAHWTDVDIQAAKEFGWHPPIDYVSRTPNTTHHNLNVSGGTDKIKYFIGGTYADDQGFLLNMDYKKYSLRASIEAKVAKNITASLQLNTNYDFKSSTNWSGDYNADGSQKDDMPSLYGWLVTVYGFIPTYLNGDLTKPVDGGWSINIAERTKSGYNHHSSQTMNALASLNYDVPFVKGLSLKAIFSQNTRYGYDKRYDINHQMYTLKVAPGSQWRTLLNEVTGVKVSNDPGIEYLQNSWNRLSSYQFNGQVNYIREFGKHHVDAFAVFEQSESYYNDMTGKRKSFPVVRTDQFWATSSDTKNYVLYGSENAGARLSYVGKVNYNFSDKYLLSASIRSDGSMGFAPERRWGTFPAVSLGWRMSEESFFKDNVNFMDMLKIRATYGVTGNDNVAGWQWQDQYLVNQTYVIGGKPVNGITTGGYTNGRYYNVSNPNLTWEKSASYNIGFDSRMLSSITFSAEFWNRHTTDILGGRIASYPVESGIEPSDQNYGIVDSHGIEFELGYDGKIGQDFIYSVKGNFSYSTNKVKLADVAQNAQDVDNPNGKPLGYLKGLHSVGLIRTLADLDKLPAGYTINDFQPELGMINYEDVSGPEGKPDGKIDDYDRVVISNFNQAPYTCGLNLAGNWKGISLDIFFQGNFGHQKLYQDELNYRMANPWDMPYKFWNDSWTIANPNGKYPRQMAQWSGVSPSNNSDSDFWLMDASYVRLKQASLSYTLPKNLTKKAGIDAVRFILSGTNLLTWTKMTLYDPELNSFSAYPIMRTTTLGINITL